MEIAVKEIFTGTITAACEEALKIWLESDGPSYVMLQREYHKIDEYLVMFGMNGAKYNIENIEITL